MLLFKLMAVIPTIIAVGALPSVRDSSTSSRSAFKLQARDVPRCPQQPGYSGAPNEEARRHSDASTDLLATRTAGWLPSLCQKKYWICVYLSKGVTYASSGVPGSGHVEETFSLDDGSVVQAIWYWQGTLQYTATGGTVNIYPAHGNFWICVKGGMRVQALGQIDFDYYGNEADLNDLVCHCYWKDDGLRSSDDDIIIYPTA